MCDVRLEIWKASVTATPEHSAFDLSTQKQPHTECRERLGGKSQLTSVGLPQRGATRPAFRAHLKQCPADPCQIHQHYARVDPRGAVERVPGEAAVPADLGHLVLRGHRCQLGPVEGPQQQPDVVHGPQEQNISVHVKQRVHILQDYLVAEVQLSIRNDAHATQGELTCLPVFRTLHPFHIF